MHKFVSTEKQIKSGIANFSTVAAHQDKTLNNLVKQAIVFSQTTGRTALLDDLVAAMPKSHRREAMVKFIMAFAPVKKRLDKGTGKFAYAKESRIDKAQGSPKYFESESYIKLCETDWTEYKAPVKQKKVSEFDSAKKAKALRAMIEKCGSNDTAFMADLQQLMAKYHLTDK